IEGPLRVARTALEAGYTRDSRKVYIRIASPVELGTFDDPGISWQEKRAVRFEEELRPPRGQSEREFAYHRIKRGIAAGMNRLGGDGLAFVSLHPSGVISTLTVNHPTLIEAYEEVERSGLGVMSSWFTLGMMPRPVSGLATDAVTGEAVGAGIARAALASSDP